jgi:hypothetical protein
VLQCFQWLQSPRALLKRCEQMSHWNMSSGPAIGTLGMPAFQNTVHREQSATGPEGPSPKPLALSAGILHHSHVQFAMGRKIGTVVGATPPSSLSPQLARRCFSRPALVLQPRLHTGHGKM